MKRQSGGGSWNHALQLACWFVSIVVVIGLMWVAYAKYVIPWLAKSMPSEATNTGLTAAMYGLSGDMFGGLNTLFAGLAFAFVALAAYFQRQTMLSQKEELEAAKAQGVLQAFEPLFFQLIELFRDLRQDVQVSAPHTTFVVGCDGPLESPDVEQYIRRIAQEARLRFVRGDGTAQARAEALALIQHSYEELHQRNEGALGPMFRTLYHAIRLIGDSKLPAATQVRYANIVRGLLGGEFLMLVMLNSISSPGAGMKPFIEHFGLLKHIRRDRRDESDLFVASFYEPSALVSYDERKNLWGPDGPPALPA